MKKFILLLKFNREKLNLTLKILGLKLKYAYKKENT